MAITKESSELRVYQHTITTHFHDGHLVHDKIKNRLLLILSSDSQDGDSLEPSGHSQKGSPSINACKLTLEVDRKPSPETMDLL